MKHVGEALQVASNSIDEAKRKVYCIGIATWGIVEHRKQLRDHSVSDIFLFGWIKVKQTRF